MNSKTDFHSILHDASDIFHILMYGFFISLLPAITTAIYFFGIGAFVSFVLSIVTCLLFDYTITRFILSETYNFKQSGIYVNAILFAFCLPSNIPYWIIILGALILVGMSKLSYNKFNLIFNPVMVAYILLDLIFNTQMHKYPLPIISRFSYPEAHTGITLLETYKNALTHQMPISNLAVHSNDIFDLIFGLRTGSLGEISAIALVLGGGYLLLKKYISWQIPLSILFGFSIFAIGLNLFNPNMYPSLLFQLLTGSVLLVAFFIATDSKTSPIKMGDKIIFGLGIGVLTIFFRCFTPIIEGTAYAVLIMNLSIYSINRIREWNLKSKQV